MKRPLSIDTLQNAQQKYNPSKDIIKVNTNEPSLLEKLEHLLSKDISFFGKPFSDKIKESFYLELGSLMKAGLDIKTALELIGDEQPQKAAKAIMRRVLEKVLAGKSLSSALKEDKNFTAYEYFTVEIGEETGRLITVLQRLSSYYKNKIKQKRQIISALTYPAIVLSVAFLSVTFMMNYVVPMFADAFKRFGGDLPFLTQQVLNISHFMHNWMPVIVPAFIAFTAFILINRRKKWYKAYKDRVILRIPVVSTIVSKIYMTRFASTMHLLLSAKIPMVQGLDLCRQIIGFYPLANAISNIERDILRGDTLYQSMTTQKIFSSKMVALVKVGEEVNQLEIFFGELAERYTEEIDYQSAQLSKFIEPVIIITLGLVVGLILIAMYLPMFKMGNTID